MKPPLKALAGMALIVAYLLFFAAWAARDQSGLPLILFFVCGAPLMLLLKRLGS